MNRLETTIKRREYVVPWELDLDGDGYVFCDEYYGMSEQNEAYETDGYGANHSHNPLPRRDVRSHIASSQASVSWISHAQTHAGNVRRRNADACLERPDLGLWAVADGMGLHAGGQLASQRIVTALDAITAQETLSGFTDAVIEVLRSVNRELFASGAACQEVFGSTVVALLSHGCRCCWLWAGTSRAYRYRDGTLTQLTTDHTVAQLQVKVGLLTPEKATSHPTAKKLTHAVGTSEDLYIDGNSLPMYPGDRYLLCSDGLHKHVTDDELCRVLQNGTPPHVARALIGLALLRGGTDNMTAAVVDIH